MKASEMPVGARVRFRYYESYRANIFNSVLDKYEFGDTVSGTVVGNKSGQGDEVIIVELDDDFYSLHAVNVNDVKRIGGTVG